MNNRKETNARGANPRTIFKQIILEPPTLTKDVLGSPVQVPNPRYYGEGTKRVIHHRNKVR